MSEFRQALDAHAAGRLELSQLERELHLTLAREPQLVASQGALIEALYRSGRIKGETYLALNTAIRAFQKSQVRVEVRPAPASTPVPGDDKTQFRAPKSSSTTGTQTDAGADGEKTQFRPPRAAGAAPAESAPPAASAATQLRPTPTDTSAPTDGRSRPTNSSWTDVGRAVADAPTLGPGSVVKDRFVLEEELGRGGMGVVFKARDLRKEEAQDRNPWVALKLLNEEFRRHPESLKALQRESRKAQQLAHANVVTVYDFDRDGGNVFMVMELLEGQSLDRIIRDHEDGGVGLEQALRLTRDMCRAMAYAHDRGVVHSDFKPANAFLTNDNVVKVFDFGIARAAKRADNISGSVTLFDPATLGALTPTYASCEMLEGLEPDPRDDVYAMACVAYELIAGKHPFNRVSAVEARDKGMVAKRPRGLNRQQWRAILHGLEFSRERRTASAQQFLNELIPRAGRTAVSIGIAAVVVLGVVIAGFLVPAYLAKRRERAVMDALVTADPARLDALVKQLRDMNPEQRATILLNEGARAGLIKAFETRIDGLTEPNQPHSDYVGAQALLSELQAFLPDSLAVRDLADRLAGRENDEIKRLSDRFDDFLKRGLLIDRQGSPNVGTILGDIRRIDAQNRLLHDPRLPGAFAEQTNKALQAGNSVLAQALVAAGLSFDSKDAALSDLRDQVQRAINGQQLLARRKALEAALAALAAPQASFTDIESRRAELEELRGIAPDSAVLASVQSLAQRGVSEQIVRLEGANQHAQALELIARYADLLPAGFVDQQRQKLASARGAYQAEQAALGQLKTRIDALLQNQKTDSDWSAQFDRELRQLAAYVSAADPYVVQVKIRAADGFLGQERVLRASQRLTEAGRMLDLARLYAPQSVEAESRLLAQARNAQETATQERNRLAQLEALKTKLIVQARANEVNEALTSLQELRANLPADDGYIAVQAPQAIGSAYLRLASNAAREGRFTNAVNLTARAKDIAPSLSDIAPASERYSRYQVIEATLKSSAAIDPNTTRAELDRLGRQDAREAAAVNERLATEFGARIRALTDAAEARRLTAVAQQIFGSQLAAQIPSDTAAGHSSATPQTPAPSMSGTNDVEGAEKQIGDTATSSVTPITTGTPATPTSASSRSAGQNNTHVAMVRPSAGTALPEQAGTARAAPEIECSQRLAGYGRRKQAVCYDTFNGGGRGPDLVVIPTGTGVAKPFALGRTEVSNADYALFCTRSGHCAPPAGQSDYPVVNISLNDAKAYVTWLSQVTGVTYRLPSDSEWTYAATALGGAVDSSAVNCLVEIGGKKVRGEELEPVQSGSPNAWGLFNALGNAQEWVLSGSGALASGGAYSDNMSSCTPDARRSHAEAGDTLTGLRVLREIP